MKIVGPARGWEGEIAWPGLVVGRGFDFGRFQFDVEVARKARFDR